MNAIVDAINTTLFTSRTPNDLASPNAANNTPNHTNVNHFVVIKLVGGVYIL